MKQQQQFFCFNSFNNFKKPTRHLKWGSHVAPETTLTILQLQLHLHLQLQLPLRLQLHLPLRFKVRGAGNALQRRLNVFLFVCRHVAGAAAVQPASPFYPPRLAGPRTSGALNLSLGFVAQSRKLHNCPSTFKIFKRSNCRKKTIQLAVGHLRAETTLRKFFVDIDNYAAYDCATDYVYHQATLTNFQEGGLSGI